MKNHPKTLFCFNLIMWCILASSLVTLLGRL